MKGNGVPFKICEEQQAGIKQDMIVQKHLLKLLTNNLIIEVLQKDKLNELKI
jgi:hypothetical protein